MGRFIFRQLNPGLVLGVGVGVHQDACGGVPGVSLNRLEVAPGLYQLIGGAGVAQPMKNDLLKFRVLVAPFPVPLGQSFRGNRQTIGKPKQLTAVAVAAVGFGFVLLELFKPGQEFIL